MSILSQLKSEAVAALSRRPPSCAQLRAEEDRLRARREALEAKNVERRKAAETLLVKRHAAERESVERRHATERARLDALFGCQPHPARRKPAKQPRSLAPAPVTNDAPDYFSNSAKDRRLREERNEREREAREAWFAAEVARDPRLDPATKELRLARDRQAPTIDERVAVPVQAFDIPAAPFTIDALREIVSKLRAGTVSFTEYRTAFAHLLASRVALLAAWEGQTKQQLYPRASASELARYTKPQLVARKWSAWLHSFVLEDASGVYAIRVPRRNEDVATTVSSIVEAVTPQDLEAHNAKVRAALAQSAADEVAKQARMAAPDTLADFHLLALTRGVSKMTTEQRVRFEQLQAEEALARREATRAPMVSLPDVGKAWTIVATWHFRKGVPTWTVQKATKGRDIPDDEFKRLNAAARTLGGSWERFTKTDGARKAVPGFLFFSEASAEKFAAALAGATVDTAEEVAARQARDDADRAEHLRELAARTGAVASAELGRDRKTNTHKRSTEAHAIQESARAGLALADSLARIAAAIADGRARFLRHVTHRTHVETLDRLLRRAQYKHTPRSPDVLGPAVLADVEAVEYPFPTFYGNILRGIAQASAEKPGLKRVSQRVLKMVVGKDDRSVTFDRANDIEVLRTLARGPGGKRITDEMVDYSRVQAMQLTDQAMLRAALREYLGCCKGSVQREDPVAAMVRGLQGRKFPGYFPTPKDLAAEVVDLADVSDGHRVLEPSAGKGDLASAVLAAAPGAELVVLEIQSELAELLQAKGFNVAGRDFFAESPETLGTFDRIVANPPFEELADMRHVQRMYEFLRPGGRIVSIMGEGAFFHSSKNAVAFRDWLRALGGTSFQNPPGSFLSSDRPTGVATRTVVIDRPGS